MHEFYFSSKREEIRKIWLPESRPINLDLLSQSDKCNLGIIINAAGRYSNMRFLTPETVFGNATDLFDLLSELLSKEVIRINPHIHISAFSDDGYTITNFNRIGFDLNIVESRENLEIVEKFCTGDFNFSNKSGAYLSAATSVIELFFTEMSKQYYIDCQSDVYMFRPFFNSILRKYSLYECLDYISISFSNVRKINRKEKIYALKAIFDNFCGTFENSSSIRKKYKIPHITAFEYVFYTLLKLDNDSLNLPFDMLCKFFGDN